MEKNTKKFIIKNINTIDRLLEYDFQKRFNRIDGTLESYIFKLSKSYYITVNAKTGLFKIFGYFNTSNGIELIKKMSQLLSDEFIEIIIKE